MSPRNLAALVVTYLVAVGGMWTWILVAGLQPQLGLDLQGGVSANLVPAAGQEVDSEVLDQTVDAIRERVDALGVAEPDVARVGADTVQVQLPGVQDPEQAIELIGRTAQLQFRQVLEVLPPGAAATAPTDEATEPADGVAYTAPADCQPENILPPEGEEVILCLRSQELEDPSVELPREEWSRLRLGPVLVAGDRLTDARAEIDPSDPFGQRWVVALELDAEGAEEFEEATGQLACEQGVRRQLAIVLDSTVETAPPVAESVLCNTGIPGGTAVITVGGAEDEARPLAAVLRAGALPIQLEFGTIQNVTPTLGRDSLSAGLLAGLIGLVLVATYLIVLYRGLGAAAILELAMFGVTVYGMIIVLGEVAGFTLTLAGVAGVIVSIGIAADSSIIYRERYRDEVRAGRTLRTAADHAFRKAWRTNLSGNFVSFLAAVVLWLLAVGPVRGFAFTLGLSTLLDTLLFATFTRGVFGLIARSKTLADSSAMGMRAGVTPGGVS